jgi:hypothetical protein
MNVRLILASAGLFALLPAPALPEQTSAAVTIRWNSTAAPQPAIHVNQDDRTARVRASVSASASTRVITCVHQEGAAGAGRCSTGNGVGVELDTTHLGSPTQPVTITVIPNR